ncbi:MAG: phosphoribosylglycinamide formyltransferase [Phycisphaerae bacterium]
MTNRCKPLPARLAILISGSGTTLQNLAEHIAAGKLAASVACVISSRPDVYGLVRAANLHLPATVVNRRAFSDTLTFSAAVFNGVRKCEANWVILAGFLSLLHIPPEFENRVLNIHPALLPKYGGRGMHGRHVHQAVIDAGETISGCTVHYADNQYDHGPIILQRTCPVLPGDTAELLAARVFAQECIAYPQAIARCVDASLAAPKPA